MRFFALGLLLAGCSFDPAVTGPVGAGDTDAAPGSGADAAPPVTADVRFTSVTASVAELAPGLYGIEVVAVLQNDLDVDITAVAASLSFGDGSADRAADFSWRDFDMREGVAEPQPSSVTAGGQATYRFKVDALPWAIPPGPIQINGSAAFDADGTALSATPLDPPLSLAFAAMNPTIVVNRVEDENDDDTEICFREALARALSTPGLDRIVFDPSEFPSGTATVTMLDEGLGELPTLGAGGALVIDGRGSGFALGVDSGWEDPEGRYGLRQSSGSVVVYGIGFVDMGFNYRDEDIANSGNCGASSAQLEGGAIRVDGGTLVLDANQFADSGVAERNCFAASVRLEGGSDHRILNNHWTDQSMDSLYIDTATIEISGNVMDGGSNLDRVDDCIYVNTQGGSDLWITGNVCVDQEYSGVVGRGSGSGTLYVVNNTFVRNGRTSLSAVRREQNSRAMVLRNNAYISNNPAAVRTDSGGVGVDLAFELVSGSDLCESCPDATLDSGSITTTADPMLENSGGTTRADFTPLAGSELIDSALDWLDRNGARPGRYDGQAPDRGAVETP